MHNEDILSRQGAGRSLKYLQIAYFSCLLSLRASRKLTAFRRR